MSSLDSSTKRAFYDNEERNIDIVTSVFGDKIKSVLVDCENDEYYRNGHYEYPNLEIFNDNSYAAIVKQSGGEAYLPSKGMTDQHIEEIHLWLGEGEDKSDYQLLLDWDRTITVVEGIRIPSRPATYEQAKTNIDDVVDYLMGGKERLEKFRDFFAMLKSKHVRVTIITNSPAASNTIKGGNRVEFLRLIRSFIDPEFPDEELICSADYNKNKGIALTDYFEKKGIVVGGKSHQSKKKVRKVRKTRKLKKQTKRYKKSGMKIK
jgi:hypothetical protein